MNRIYKVFRSTARNVILSLGGSYAMPSKGIHILTGHFAHRTYPEAKYMEQTMNKLSKIVKFIRIEDAVNMICNHETPDEPLVAFTFDDGFDDCYFYLAPVLEKYGINAAFFVNPNYVEGNDQYIEWFNNTPMHNPGKRPMRWNQLQELNKRGFVIGAHTMDHYLTASNNIEELKHQIVDCKAVIENNLNSPCEYFAWPYGRLENTNQVAVEMACETYKYVFSQTNYRHYFSYNGKVINRRHFEPFWPINHVRYFLSKNINY